MTEMMIKAFSVVIDGYSGRAVYAARSAGRARYLAALSWREADGAQEELGWYLVRIVVRRAHDHDHEARAWSERRQRVHHLPGEGGVLWTL